MHRMQSCQYNKLCTPLNSINPYCMAVIQEPNDISCSQCTCNREPPYCLCYDQFVPVQGNDICCKNCDEGTYYSLVHDNCKNQIANNIVNYNCPENDTCQDCRYINPYLFKM
ncbi:hypothetical protein PPERSA_02582 [Pseudocohnilembus persalinus]|uniref:Insulin-like growth factor binding protein, N-terminal n=1 Tax=Pseudocohnilembus persalinus TaxID=266149 RepID=A0A0V0R5F7_PSEPJ|nr:hypothetical protein PPERSA_02582 [Pseudocohnilembus persalinus]|eukprot:KRX09710.1 hypothetical protein PPERSA_02582 [Pseudocohnilembus persalinus]